jgi:DNA-directed RNA polymerase subunit N
MLEEKNLRSLTLAKVQGQKDKNHTGEKMIIPIRCFSCGKPVGHLWEDFKERVSGGEDMKKVLDSLGLERNCCRALFLGHIDLVDTAGKFKKV